MRTKFIYILLLAAGLMFSCQKSEMSEPEQPVQGMEVGNEATISFSAIIPGNPETKAMTQNPTDLETMHLVVFDGNGMYVETKEAKIGSAVTHDGHNYETTFEVTLTVTDRPRFIHFIANCPVEQIIYGHEASIIGNMFTTKPNYQNEEDRTEHETAYWARIEVPYILVEETSEGSGKYRPVPGIIGSFKCIPMLRNYAQIVVKDSDKTTEFEYLGFTLYNTIDIGTVAPYNNTTQKFQDFVENGKAIKYPNLLYEGHALAAADLNTSLEMIADDGTDPYYDGYKWYNENNPFYMYERKISVKTDEEEKWKESPPHVIIKGLYNNKVNYYKVDLVYKVYGNTENSNQVTDIKYYNILRNFRYQFTISDVVGEGYPTVLDAIKGATSNNLSGSSTTSKFTNISDKVGRIWVSYTDTTLVSNNNITFRYKYQSDITVDAIDNDEVDLENIIGGTVIESYRTATSSDYEFTHHQYNTTTKDIEGGEWNGFRELILTIKNPEEMTKEQTVVLRTDNANLTRNIRFYLKDKYNLEVECTPKVAAKIGAPVEVDIKLPIGITEDMFPLDLDIEVYDLTLSPDASRNSIPVVTGPSTIGRKNGVPTFHYVKSIETKAEYDAIPTVGTQKTIKTYWLTNIEANESTVYVSNKYFNEAADDFVNAKSFNGRFSKQPISTEVGVPVSFMFDVDQANMPITVTLDHLAPIDSESGLTPTSEPRVYTYTSQTTGTQTIYLQTTDNREGKCYVTLNTDESYGYIDDEKTEIEQMAITSYTVKRSISGTLNDVTYNKDYTNYKVTITTGNESYETKGNITRSNNWPYTCSYNFTISNWDIEYLLLNQVVNINLGHTYDRNNNINYYTGTCTVQDLIDGNITNLELTKEN